MRIRMIAVAGNALRVATSKGSPGSLPLFFFNGIGANLELLRPFAAEMEKFGVGIIAFDVPGTGGSSAASSPYRLSWLANLANELLVRLGSNGQVDAGGVSWGGALAQEFTHRYPLRVRRLLLAATSAGAVSVPGRPSALAKMLDGRRYSDPDYMAEIGGELYGGKLRGNPKLMKQHSELLRSPKGAGYYYQLLALVGWTSAHWLRGLQQPTLVMAGTEDPIVPVANGRLLATLIPHARLVKIRDGHLFLLTSVEECAPIISYFLYEQQWPRERAAQPAGSAPFSAAATVVSTTR
jgi:poly(3-hydroxyalkanoate) depolymerase